MVAPKLTAIAACRAVGLHRDRFNEHVAAGKFDCAPPTIPGRARLFNPDDMLTLKIFSQLLDDGYSPDKAGQMACSVGEAAKQAENKDAAIIAYCETYMGSPRSINADDPALSGDWSKILMSGTDIKRVTSFNVAKLRSLVRAAIEDEQSIIGPEDE